MGLSLQDKKEIIDLYIENIGKQYSKNISIKYKNESILLKILKPIIEIFNKNYWNGYITTIGSTIYVPTGWYERGDIKSRINTVAHECIHIQQNKKQGSFIHGFLYLFPQSLAALSLLAALSIFFSSTWLWSLLFLLFILPFPAPFRYKKELEAYRLEILFLDQAYNLPPSEELYKWTKEKIIKNLSKENYYFCWPFPGQIEKDLNISSEFFNQKKYQEVISFLKENNLI